MKTLVTKISILLFVGFALVACEPQEILPQLDQISPNGAISIDNPTLSPTQAKGPQTTVAPISSIQLSSPDLQGQSPLEIELLPEILEYLAENFPGQEVQDAVAITSETGEITLYKIKLSGGATVLFDGKGIWLETLE